MEESFISLENVFKIFLNCGMTPKLKKCFFSRPMVQFLGHYVESGTMSVVQNKIEAINNLPEPFLGMYGYYKNFLELFSDLAAPLTNLTQGGTLSRAHHNKRGTEENFLQSQGATESSD